MSPKGLSPARLEAFSDGIIAIIITIMVLELKVPAPDGMAGLPIVRAMFASRCSFYSFAEGH